jgi:hypothetical protein
MNCPPNERPTKSLQEVEVLIDILKDDDSAKEEFTTP